MSAARFFIRANAPSSVTDGGGTNAGSAEKLSSLRTAIPLLDFIKSKRRTVRGTMRLLNVEKSANRARLGREALPGNRHPRADGNARIKIKDILIVHPDAALRDGCADRPRRVSAVNAVEAGTQVECADA